MQNHEVKLTYWIGNRTKVVYNPMPHQWAFFYLILTLWFVAPAAIIMGVAIWTDTLGVYSVLSALLATGIWIYFTGSKS